MWDGAESVYVFGGQDQAGYYVSVLKFDTQTPQVRQVAQLPSGRFSSPAVWDTSTSQAYIFGGATPEDGDGAGCHADDILRFGPADRKSVV